MSLSRELKIQIEAIKKPEKYSYKKYDDVIMISDGSVGVYIRQEDIVMKLEKLKNLNENLEKIKIFEQKSILNNAVGAEKTKEAMILDNKTAVKLVSADGEAWIDIKYIKEFEYTMYYFDYKKRIVIFVDRNTEEAVGFAFEIKIREDEQ